jgi:23S rRNA (guanine2535-N1)-methyltransferase
MPYLFATEDSDYSDLASGRVLYNLPGAPAFPVRLVNEIYQRARARLGLNRRITLYDPVCGGAYHLCALGFLHGDALQAVLASDISSEAVRLARRNLGLLSPEGLRQRKAEIQSMLDQYGKESHTAALRSVDTLSARLDQMTASGVIHTRVFQANALDGAELLQNLSGETIDLVLSDIPYGQMSAWEQTGIPGSKQESPLWQMLAALRPVLAAGALVAVAADKQQKIAHEHYQRVERFQIGKRQVSLLRPI